MAHRFWFFLGWSGLAILVWYGGPAQADLSEHGQLTGTVVDFDTRFVRMKTEGDAGQYVQVPRESVLNDAMIRPGGRATASVKPRDVRLTAKKTPRGLEHEVPVQTPSLPAKLGGNE